MVYEGHKKKMGLKLILLETRGGGGNIVDSMLKLTHVFFLGFRGNRGGIGFQKRIKQ